MSTFTLPDLGEGLREAEIVEWHVAVDEEVAADAPLVSVETDKAVVEVPAPRAGRIARLCAKVGDIVEVGKPLVEFAGGEAAAERPPSAARADTGTVVGEVQHGEERVDERPAAVGRGGGGGAIKATPAVRALARRLEVDLAIVSPSGRNGLVTAADVERVAKRLKDLGPPERLRGARRAMAIKMAQSRAEVVPATIMEDVVVEHWPADTDITLRLLRAIVAGCRAEPSLNAWFDTHSMGRRVLAKIDVAVAVDTEEGLFVPVLRDVANRDDADLRSGLERLKTDVAARKVPPEEMRGYTITLSNYGTIAGRYATPVVVPPTVAILGAGRIAAQVVAVDGTPAVRRVLPLSLTFDHRAATGGEAGRFLAAVIASLAD